MGRWILSLAILGFQASAHAALFEFGDAGVAGSGCKPGTVRIATSRNGQTLRLLFDDYAAEAGDSKRLDRKTCMIAIPVKVPAGYSISLLPARFDGFADVSRGGAARMEMESFFAGQTGEISRRILRQGHYGTFSLTPDLKAETQWSPCGEDVNLRINSSILVRAESAGASSSMSVDSALVYQVQWRRCS